MARIPTYQKDTHISDLDRIIGTDGDTNELATKNFFLGDIAEYVIDKFIDPDAVSFTIPVFRDTQDVLGSNATRITGSIMSQDINPDGTKITITGDLTLERDQSDTTLTLISDGSNQGENNNPSIKFIQDGGAQNAAVGFNIIDDTGGGTIFGSGNRFWIVNAMDDVVGDGGITFGTAQVDGWDNAIGRFIIRGDGKGLFGHPDSLYNKTLGSQFEIYDNRDENTTTDPSFSVYSVVDYAAPSGNEGAGGIKQILDVYNNGVFEGQEAMMLIPGTSSSDFAASTPIAFYTNSDMDTVGPSGFAGKIFNSGNWLLDGSGTPTNTDPGYQLKVAGTGLFTDQVTIPLTPVANTDAASKGYVDTAVTGLLEFKGTFRADTGEILSGTNNGLYLYNCPGGAGTRVAVDTGDYYIVANTAGNFYCSGDLLQVGDSVVAVADAPADTSNINNWGILEGDNIEGSGTANKIPLWTDSQILSDSILLQDTNPSNTGLVDPGNRVKTDGTLGVKDSLTVNYTDNTYPNVFPPYDPTGDFNTKPTGRIGVVNDVNTLEWAFSAVSIGGLAPTEYSNRSGLIHRSGGGYRLLLSNATARTILFDSDGNSFINSGNLAIGHDTPTEKLDVLGNVKATNVRTEKVRPLQGDTVVKINQAVFFDTGNISNVSNTDIGATLHLRTDAPLTDQDVIALTKGGQGTGFPSGIKQNAQGEYTLLLRDNSNSQSIKLVSNKATPSFIDNGKVFLGGNTDQQDGAVTINNRRWTNGVKNAFIQFNKSGTQLDTALEFKQGSILKGSISYDSTGTNYNVTSDYRVKENIVEITDGIERLKQLKPSKFNFITDAEKVVDGFIAHEVQEVIPEAVTGEKDATEEYEVTPAEYDDYGNLVTEPVMGTRDAYQQIDQAKIVPLLTAALQEAVAKIESLEARIQTLEGN